MEFEEAFRIIELAVKQRNNGRLNGKVTIAILRGAWNGQTYEAIAEKENYTPRYLQQDAGPKLWKKLSDALGTEVNKNNFRTVIESGLQPLLPVILPQHSPLDDLTSFWNPHSRHPDLKDAPDVSRFYGRTKARQDLKDLMTLGYRLFCIYGVGGVGKTALATRLAQELQGQFAGVIYRSLNPPLKIASLQADLIRYLSDGAEGQTDWSTLLAQLAAHRCLVVLDGWEQVLRGNVHDGSYQAETEGYRELLLRLGRAGTSIQSVLLITSREQPKEIELLRRETAHTYSYQLSGLGEMPGQNLLQQQNLFVEDDSHWQELLNRYAGNPLMLNMAAAQIGIFGGNITSFLRHFPLEHSLMGDFGELLDQQLQRLSEPEQRVVRLLAESRGYVRFADILQLTAVQPSSYALVEVIQSLLRRSLIEVYQDSYNLHLLFKRYLNSKNSQ